MDQDKRVQNNRTGQIGGVMHISIERLNATVKERERMIDALLSSPKYQNIQLNKWYEMEDKFNKLSYEKLKKLYNNI